MLKIKARQVPRFLKLEFVGGVVGTDGAPGALSFFAVLRFFAGWPVVAGAGPKSAGSYRAVVLGEIG